MPLQHNSPKTHPRIARAVLTKGIHRWVFECDSTGRGALDDALDSLTSDPSSGLVEADAIYVRRRVAESLGLCAKICLG